ncbi:AAA family ATPase [Thiobacillus sp.]|uniref:AAA family ATPase n=1 Tax=Thiobacillus sp. TaxID=924 RepID=UPI00286E3A1F|nr:AAA family ATPase [Thiobacillus sp.]
MPQFNDDFNALLDARFPILLCETHEESRVLARLREICNARNVPLFLWSLADGLKRSTETNAVYNTSEFTDALKHVDATPQNGLYVFLDAHPFFDNPLNTRLVREIAFDHYRRDRTLLFVSPRLELPSELARMSARIAMLGITADRVRSLLKEEIERWQRESRRQLVLDRESLPILVHQLAGLGEEEAQRLIRQAISVDGELNLNDAKRIARFKQDQQAGSLEMSLPDVTLDQVGGFARLKTWIAQRQAVFQNPALAPGLPMPKGILLLGVQGAGKSLVAKAVAGSWKLPLLRLDFATLYNKYIGETEKNLRQALDEASRMAPCLLWMDEIEKGLSAGDADDGISQRILGTLLTWMSERDTPVFVVATANDISKLPPELLRKGRFDELFFVDLPSSPVREVIFSLHLKKRGLDPAHFQMARLIEHSEGYSGAEIEQAIIAAQYAALAASGPLMHAHVESELMQTRPLSVIRAEDFERLRGWAQQRCVMVD